MIDPERMAGVYANYARVGHSVYEFTLDFARLETAEDGTTRGIVVARVSMSPLLVSQLLAALTENWERYAEKALPPEVHRHGNYEAQRGHGEASDPAAED